MSWLGFVGGSPSEDTLECIGWIVWIASDVLYRLNRIGIGLLGFALRNWIFMHSMI